MQTIEHVFRGLPRNPGELLMRRWNWRSERRVTRGV